MIPKPKEASKRGTILSIGILINVIIIRTAFMNSPKWYYLLLITLPLLVLLSYRRR